MSKKIEESIVANVNQLSEMIDYQSGSVVSKALLQMPTGNITLFSFDAGEGLSEHKAPFDAFVNIIDGEAVIIIDKKEHFMKSGEAIIMPADIPHAVKAEKRFKMLLVMIKQ